MKISNKMIYRLLYDLLLYDNKVEKLEICNDLNYENTKAKSWIDIYIKNSEKIINNNKIYINILNDKISQIDQTIKNEKEKIKNNVILFSDNHNDEEKQQYKDVLINNCSKLEKEKEKLENYIKNLNEKIENNEVDLQKYISSLNDKVLIEIKENNNYKIIFLTDKVSINEKYLCDVCDDMKIKEIHLFERKN